MEEPEIKEIIENGAKENQRNRSLFRVACYYKSKGLSEKEILNLVLKVNEKTKPPLGENEILNIIKSSIKYKNTKNPFSNFDMIVRAKAFIQDCPLFYDKARLWWKWEEQFCWKNIDETDILNEYLDYTEQPGIASSKIQNEIINALKLVGRKNQPKAAKVKYIQFKDKVVNIENSEIYYVEDRFFFTNPIPWEIGETDETPTMDRLFEEWVGKEYIKTLYEIIAYCCLRNYPIQVLFCFIGGGRNGKTQYQKVLQNFIGKDNVCSTELDLLLNNRFESFKLYKKLACSLGETNFGILSNTSLLKKLTGGDLIGFEKKNKDPFDDYNYAKILINSNSLPSTQDTSEGFYRRWVIIDFPNQFKEGKDIIKIIPEIEYNNLCRKVINILPNLLNRGSFTNQGTIKDRKEKYIEASNPLPLFVEKFCDIHSGTWVRYSEFYSGYCLYLSKRNRRVVSRQEFSKFLDMEGYEKRRTTKPIKDVMGNDKFESGHFIEGICLKNNWKEIMSDMSDMTTFSLKSSYTEPNRNQGHNGHNEHNHIIIKDLLSDLSNVLKPVPIEELIRSCAIYDIDGIKLDDALERLKKEGVIFEPKSGFLQLL